MKSELLNFLLKAQNPDGGWGYFPAKHTALEPTAYALMALQREQGADEALNMAARLIAVSQTPEGGWPVSTSDREPAAWVTPVVGLADLFATQHSMRSQAAFKFVLSTFGRMPKTWANRVGEWLGYSAPPKNTNLGGWSWNPETAPWVEPTCYALLFLKKAGRRVQEDGPLQIVSEAESMVYDRMCKRGGWNYGNAQVLGEELRPYPLTTALALIALQDRSSRSENQASLAYLKNAVGTENSALGLCFAALCLDLYAEDCEDVWQRLSRCYQGTLFLRDIKTAALLLIVLQARKTKNIFDLKFEES
jgi:hypothetical protein